MLAACFLKSGPNGNWLLWNTEVNRTIDAAQVPPLLLELWDIRNCKKDSMFKRSGFLRMAFAVGSLLIASSQPAYAYIDPGSGAFVLQILGVFLASMLFFFRQFLFQAMERIRQLRDKIRGRPSRQSEPRKQQD